MLVEGFLAARRAGRQADRPPLRLSGVRPAVRAGRGHDAVSGGVPHGPSACRAMKCIGRCRPATTIPARPDIVLFNGGFFAAPVLRERLLEVLASWFNLQRSAALDARGARERPARSGGGPRRGLLRHGPPRPGTRISAGLARTYYIGVESDVGQRTMATPSAVCLVPAGVEEGQSIDLESPQFHLLDPPAGRVSAVRLQHAADRSARRGRAGSIPSR